MTASPSYDEGKPAFGRTTRAEGYSAPSSASVYALAEPDCEPLPQPTRVLTVWEGHRFTEIDPTTRAVLAEGRIDTHATEDDGA